MHKTILQKLLVLGAMLFSFQIRAADPEALSFDAMSKDYDAKEGEQTAAFTFNVTNTAPNDVVINWVRTSCGCTVAKLPSTPWILHPKDHGQIEVSVDLRGKFGVLNKFVTVDSTVGSKMLTLKISVPTPAPMNTVDGRTRNIQMALADRQAVFKNDCVSCHVTPAAGKLGEPLYQAACAVCHDAPHRATMVPDLHALPKTPTREGWKTWVTSGKVGSLMPAFAKAEGGPLDDAQIDSLVEYLVNYFPQRPVILNATPHHDD